jgi:hypothetical protein
VSGYGQFCPVSKAMELLDERWTMLVARELPLGSRHFNELRPTVEALAAWGIRWIPELGDEDLPGLPEPACVETDLCSLAMVWRGDLGWPEALRSGRVEVLGPGWARRSVPRWLGQSPMAGVPRVAAAAT